MKKILPSHVSTENNYYLELNEEGQPTISSSQIYSVQLNSIITLHLYNGSLITQKIMLISNVYQSFPSPWYLDSLIGKEIDLSKEKAYLRYPSVTNTSIYFIIQTQKPGINLFALVYYDEKNNKYNMTQPFTILIEPELILYNNERLNLQSIRLQTVYSKNIGKINQFTTYFKECSLLKYNMIHFSTFQELSDSDSLYTVKNQLKISDTFFEEKLSNEEKMRKVKQSIEFLREEYQIRSIVDVILNQTSKDSEWIIEHPECGYNLQNCPWLNVAYELDKILVLYSNKFYEKKVGCKSAPFINNDNDLDEAIIEITKEVNRSNLEEFFLIPIEKFYDEFKLFYSKYKEDEKSFAMKRSYLFNELKHHPNITFDSKSNHDKPILSEESLYYLIYNSCSKYGENLFGVNIEVEFVGILLLETLANKTQLDEYGFLKEVKYYINRINDDWTKNALSMISLAIANVKECIRYEFIQMKRIGIKKKLIENYFVVNDANDKQKIFACNGWLIDSEESAGTFIDFTKYDKWYYLKRKLMVWPDTIKLNYGNSKDDYCSYLMNYMTQYVQQMASIFDGFMVDSLISLPIFALQLLMKKARDVNPNIILIGGLLDGTKEDEALYANKVGIHLFTRELIWCSSIEDISDKVIAYGEGSDKIRMSPHSSLFSITSNEINFELTKVSMTEYLYLQPKDPGVILFDLTNDNETYYERFNNISLNLSIMACLSMCDCAIGSTRGFDQLFPVQPSVTKENRLYSYDDSFENMLREISFQSSQSAKKKEVFFEFHPRNSINPLTKTVRLALSNTWTPDISLTKINDNLFTAKVELPKGKYHYKYILDGNVWTIDPLKPMENDSGNNANNVLDICDETKLLVPDLKILRHDLNAIRDDCKGKKTEVFVSHDKELISIMRLFKPCDINKELDYDGYGIICRPGFDSNKKSISSKILIPGEIYDFISGCYMITTNFDMNLIRSEPLLNGLKGNSYYTKDLKFLSSISNISIVRGQTIIDFHSILPNTVLLFKIKLNDYVRISALKLNEALRYMNKDENDLISNLDIFDINHALFKCEKEEKDSSFNKRGIYKIEDCNSLSYAGLTNLYQTISNYNRLNVIDNPIWKNIKDGDWLIGYTLSRMKELQSFQNLNKYLEDNVVKEYSKLYSHLKPFYFTMIIETLYYLILKSIFAKIPSTIVNYGDFTQTIYLATHQFLSHVFSSTFNHLLGKKQLKIDPNELKLSISAGLPHYSIEYYRSFGRETFMSFKGLLLLPRRFNEAKTIIKMYAVTLRHGMIPNLLGCGTSPRFNGRDCPWLFIQAIKDYVSFTNDYGILKEELEMIFLSDKMDMHLKAKAKGESRIMILSDIIQEIFQSHAQGIEYREWKAGNEIDHNLSYEGFNIQIHLEPKTGFIYGGSQYNAGTWMNRIGTSERSRNKGKPSTPRNGADIEIIALVYSSLDFIIKMFELGYYNHRGVTLKNGSNYPFTQWKLLINDNFEEMFYLSRKTHNNKDGIYRDYISNDNNKLNECQLRPNYLIAMVISPELFKKHNAIKAIENAEKYLLPPDGIGLRSLDHEDKTYFGALSLFETGEYFTSNGFNMHNGPEYVWLIGYYLLAKLQFCCSENKSDFLNYSSKVLIPLMKYIKSSPWMGLPDYTEEKEKECESACGTYSISIALVHEVINIMASYSQ